MRFWEIDLLRGIAILSMIAFHIFFDLKYFGLLAWGSRLSWWLAPRLIAGTFIFLVGISLSLSYSRVARKPEKIIVRKYLLRGLKIFSWGLAITAVTWFLVPEGFIFFGILHFIGLSVAFSYPFLRWPKYNFALGLAAMLTGSIVSLYVFPFPYLVWLGFIYPGAYSLDFFPLFPWFGLILLGIYYGNILYPGGKRGFCLREARGPLKDFLTFIGRNSLKIYLIHQPIILGIIFTLT